MTGFATGPFLAGLGWSALAVAALLGVTFALAVAKDRHRFVDVTWGLGFVLVAVVSALAGHGDVGRRVLVAVLTGVWGLRLAGHLYRRNRGGPEDPRYEELLAKAPGSRAAYALRKIYLTQGVVLWFVSLPVQIACYERPSVGVVGWVGVAVWAVGVVFEAVGDEQLSRFKADPASRGQVMDRGLWHYTRHPNYFGDACVWWGLYLVAAAHWPGMLTVLSPAFMTFLLARGTGKPLLEKRMATTRPGYAEYVERTSGFLPLPPRATATGAGGVGAVRGSRHGHR